MENSFKYKIGFIYGETYYVLQNNYPKNYINGDIVIVQEVNGKNENVKSVNCLKKDKKTVEIGRERSYVYLDYKDMKQLVIKLLNFTNKEAESFLRSQKMTEKFSFKISQIPM